MYDIGNSKNITTSNRLIHYDLMRVLACFCVIVIHIGICDDNPTNGAFSIDSSFFSLYSIVARWAVPCFLMVSGVMFLDKNKNIPIKNYMGNIFLDLQCLMRFGHAFMHYTTLSMMQAILLLKNSSILRATACQGNYIHGIFSLQ